MIEKAFTIILLLLAGDVERNSGPTNPELAKLMSDMRTALQGSIDAVIESQETLQRTVGDKLSKLNGMLKTIARHTEQIAELKSEVLSLKKVITAQQRKFDDFEDRSRRRNVLIFGLSEQNGDTPGGLRKRVLSSVFHAKLGVATKFVERVHRISKNSKDKPRPIMLNFFHYNEKVLIMRNCKNLKGSPISISHAFCKTTLSKRSKLWLHAKQFREQGRKVSLDYDRLRVDNNVYAWDEETA